MASAEDVARYIINRSDWMDNLKLQKLMYYAQAVHLVLNDKKPLFDEKIEAWLYGPVVPEIYREYKAFGIDNIPKTRIDDLFLYVNEIDSIDTALDFYGKFSGPDLINRTHREKPWIDAYENGQNTEITKEAIYDYFKKAFVFS